MTPHQEQAAPQAIRIQGVSKRYGSAQVLQPMDLTVRPGELFTLLGPSGSGKTTLLNIISGFTYADAGQVFIDAQRVDQLPIHLRNIGMVFQNYSLFPHMTVENNVRFPLQLRKVPRDEEARRVREALQLVAMDDSRGKYPSQLSGGQQQRVAIARAIVFQPRVLLLDEPLSALDRQLRYQLQLELRRIHRALKTTMVFVTHDQDEAFTMSDRIAILHEGRIAQVGTPAELYDAPQSLFVAQFLGISSGAQVTRDPHAGAATVRLPDGTEVAVHMVGTVGAGTLQVNIKAERAHIRGTAAGGRNGVPGTIRDVIFAGNQRRYVVDCALSPALIVSVPNTRENPVFEAGQQVFISWAAEDLLCFGS